MNVFGWEYPPGVTGREPEIAGDDEFDCECSDDHYDCDDRECECIGHDEGCASCHVRRGCICDDLYERWKESRRGDD